MAYIEKRGNAWRAQIRRTGAKPLSATFKLRQDAKDWAVEQEAALAIRSEHANGFTLGSLMTKYLEEVTKKNKRAAENSLPDEGYGVGPHLRRFAVEFADVELADLTEKWWVETITARNLKPSTRVVYMQLMQRVLKKAEASWNVTGIDWRGFQNARAIMAKRGDAFTVPHRERRLLPGEIERIKAHYIPDTLSYPLADIVDLALILGFLISEIARLRWEDLDARRRLILVRNRKHKTRQWTNHQKVPLLDESLEIIEQQPRTPKYIFEFNPRTLSQAFRRICAKVGVEDLHFHDLRHEAISRLFERGFSIPEVQMVSGHSDWRSMQIYTNLKPENLLRGPALLQHKTPKQLPATRKRAA